MRVQLAIDLFHFILSFAYIHCNQCTTIAYSRQNIYSRAFSNVVLPTIEVQCVNYVEYVNAEIPMCTMNTLNKSIFLNVSCLDYRLADRLSVGFACCECVPFLLENNEMKILF